MVNRLPKNLIGNANNINNNPVFCHRHPPIVVQVGKAGEFGGVSLVPELRFINCAGSSCALFCEEVGLCADTCEHQALHCMDECGGMDSSNDEGYIVGQ